VAGMDGGGRAGSVDLCFGPPWWPHLFPASGCLSMPWRERCGALYDAACALVHLHTLGAPSPIAHGAVRPAHILIDPQHGCALLAGAGSADGAGPSLREAEAGALVADGYLDPAMLPPPSPAAMRVPPAPSPAADAYALGVTILVTLTGHPAAEVPAPGGGSDGVGGVGVGVGVVGGGDGGGRGARAALASLRTRLASGRLPLGLAEAPGMGEPWPDKVAERLAQMAVALTEPIEGARMPVASACRLLCRIGEYQEAEAWQSEV
jgi:hypothetical protein